MNSKTEWSEQRRQGARAAGYMMLAGAALAAVSVALPPQAMRSDLAVLGLGVLCAVVGTMLLAMRTPPPEWVLGFAAATGTVVITVATYEGGRVSTGAIDNVMLYVWICLLAFNFLNLKHALLQLTLVGGCYAFLLADEPFGEAATRWVISVSSLLIAGLLVHMLQSSRWRLVDELSERAHSDGLTGLLNRVALEERAILELARTRPRGTALSLLVLDIDRFKQLNDTEGHPAGDEVLRAIAGRLRQETREVDAVARLGGDEFGALLPGAGRDDAMRIAERLVAQAPSREPGQAEITLSVGVAQVMSPDDSFETLWRAADSAMYEAKRAGGGAVRCYAEPAPDQEELALDLNGVMRAYHSDAWQPSPRAQPTRPTKS